MNASWYLIAGSTGAGKTTVAREIAKREGAVVFSIDEWMQNLYWMDCPEKNDLSWALDRIARCEAQIEATAQELAAAGVSSVLDLGFTLRVHREEWLARARSAGVLAKLEVIDIPAEVRWERVCQRNQSGQAPSESSSTDLRTKTFSFEVTREMFDFMERRWEPVSAEEHRKFLENSDFEAKLK